MAQITWRNVDAPNFSGSLDGLRVAGGMLNNATNSLNEGLKTFGEAQQQRADAAAMINALQYSDPAAYREALANGSLLNGVDPSQVSARTLAALDGRTGQLIDNAGNQQRQDILGYNFDRVQDQNINSDAARNAIGQIYAAQQSGNSALANKLIAENAGVLGNLTADEQANLYKTGGALVGTDLQNRGTALLNTGRSIDNQGAQLQLDQTRQGINDRNEVTSLLNSIQGSVLPGDADGARALVEANAGRFSTQGLAMLRNAVNSQYPGAYSLSGSGSTSGGNTRLMTGGAQLPSSIQTVGDIVDNKSGLLGVNPKGTATGTYQITADTWQDFAPKALGDNWKSARIDDPVVQDAVAKEIWNSVKDDPAQIKARWASFTPAQAEAAKGKSWEDIRGDIAQRESATPASALPVPVTIGQNADTALALSNLQRNVRSGQNTSQQQWMDTLAQTQNDRKTSVSDAVDNLLKGSLKGTDRGYLLDQVNRVVQETGYTPATAQKIIESNLEGSNNIFQNALHGIRTLGGLVRNNDSTPDLGNGVRFNDAGLNNALALSRTNNPIQTAMNQRDLQVTTGQIQTARDQLTQATNAYNELIRRLPSQPSLAGQVKRYQDQVARAQNNLNMLLSGDFQNPNNRPLVKEQQNPNIQVPPSQVAPSAAPAPVATSVGSPRTFNQNLLDTYAGLRR